MEPRLKSLELLGYKTFASRTSFEFPGMITAVVGPNGSGKSNVADSMRWVLGEQSYSLLRGKKTEDMIFAGSEQRGRSGMASATITFDNSDGWLPIDYSEVSITRRAYRDGQNEYLLNGQKVRLKEISELLAQSGLAERTYTIIGQGLVDAALALKPEERRRLFEEAAGIGLYRSRKEEAINRLEATRRNLERVKDILAELEPRLQSLEKQAKRAQDYERVKADLRLLLQDWYGYHWHQNQGEFNHVRDILKSQGIRLESVRQSHAEVSQAMNESRGKIHSIRARLNEWHTSAGQLHNELTQVSRQSAILDERQHSLNEQRSSWQNELARSEEEDQAFQANLELAEQELIRLETEVEEARSHADLSRKKLIARQEERERVERSLRNARQNLIGSETRLVQLTAHHYEIENRQETILENIGSILKTINSFRQDLEKSKANLQKLVQEKEDAERVKKGKEAELLAHRTQVTDQEVERRRLQNQKSRIEAEKARLKAQTDVLEQAERAMSGYSEGARFLVQAARQDRLKGDYRLLSSLLDVPVEYETAFAAVLGEMLDLVLLDPAAEVENTLSLIERDSKGRVAFIKVEQVLPVESLVFPEDTDAIGVAADLVAPKEETLAPLIKFLLGRTLVVKDRQAAYRLIASLPASGQIVTLKGELFSSHGHVVAGKVGRTGMISRSRQIREKNDALSQLDGQLNANRSALQSLDQALEKLRAQESDLVRQSKEMGIKAEKTREVYQQGLNAQEQIRRQAEWYEGQQKDLDNQIARVKIELAKDEAELVGIDMAIAKTREEVRKFQRDLGELPVDEFQSQVTHWDTAIAVSSRALKESQKRVDERKQRLVETQQRQGVLRKRLEELEAGLSEIDHQKDSLHTREESLNAEIQAFQAIIEPAEKDLTEAERQSTDLLAVEAASLQALTVAERHFTQAELDLDRNRDALQALRRRIEDDFGLVAFEYAPNVSGQTPLPFEGMVNRLPVILELAPEIEEAITRFKTQLRRMGSINPDALNEFRSVQDRFQFMTSQVADLSHADADLRQVIGELDELMKRDFRRTFNAVAVEFRQMFTRLFGGGSAHLVMMDEDNPIDTGIDIEARLPGRREQGLSLLSGGERSLTAVALVFSLLKVSPTPFCVMDEVDAMLDESNVGRFCDMLRELSHNTQFIIITHNRNTVQIADVVYGITMGRDSTSQTISVKLDEVSDDLVI